MPTVGSRRNAPSTFAWPPRAHRRCVRIASCPVPRWYPGKVSAGQAPNPGVFYSARIRASLAYLKGQHATRAIFSELKSEIKLDFHRTPQPFTTSPLLVADKDVAFAVANLAKGDSLGVYQALLPNGQDFLSRTRVDNRPGSANQRVVLNYTGVSLHSQRAQSSKSIFQAHRQRRVAIASLHDVQVVRQGTARAPAGLPSHPRQVAAGATTHLAYHSTLAYRRVVARDAGSSGTAAGVIATTACASSYAQPHSGTVHKRSHGAMRRRVEPGMQPLSGQP